MALAAMDSESGCLPLDYLQGHKDGLEWAAQLAEANHPETGDWLYDDPIELAKAIRKGPDMPPAQPVADSEPVAVIDLANLDYLLSGADADVWPPEREEMGDVLLYRHAQPAPVVPKSISVRQAISALESAGAVTTIGQAYKMGWNACRAAMLQELKKSAGTEAICRSDENVQVLHTKSPAQSDCCPAQNSVNPAQGGNYLVIPDEMTAEQAYEIGYYYGDPVDVFARGANWMRQHIIDSTLAAAPQSPGSEPATVPGKWIPVSERMPELGDWLVTDGCDFDVQLFNGEQFIPGFVWEDKITHWMPLPAVPQEVKGE
ncbi:DUF551 domain-containing protein [Klebsiella pneumoniae]|nr:DUF551 domain-containing protein [Klebsiella pneumoniae]